MKKHFPDEPLQSHTLDMLWEVQNEKGYIPNADITRLSARLGISEIELEGVASFYHFFHRKPAGQFCIYVNNSILAEFKGYRDIVSAFEKATGAALGGTDASGTFGLFETPCIGLCDQEPSALINFYPFTHLTPAKVAQIVDGLRSGVGVEFLSNAVEDNIRYTPEPDKTVLLRAFEPGSALEPLLRLAPDEVLSVVKESGISGRGGAFFPTGLKWELCRKNESDCRYIVCNADEGEPGTFKDRVLINRLPGLLIEGMIVAGYAAGAARGIIYLRAEYRWLLPKLHAAIEMYEHIGWLGADAPTKEPFRFDIRVQIGAGSYVCGEETALLESLEGKRGEPRTKTFFPVERGYLGRPTVVNNVETLCFAARVMELGAEFFQALGTPVTRGTKLLSVAGDCNRPGIFEIEWGMTVAELLELCEASDPYFIQVSGPSGQCISAWDSHRRFAGEDLLCGGAIMVFDHTRDILQILRNFTAFFQHESCGMCTPCRAGNFIFSRKLDKMARGLGSLQDITEMQQWAQIMKRTTRCGLGMTAPNPLLYAIDRFPEYFEKKLDSTRTGLNRSFDLESALEDYRDAVQ
ncbi:MAG: NAD(P)H-dependent oxidoreductase subunit E [Saprospiraceae bacterium]|nr:NAD(P)H-dependent oxidoreductase subunit E [Saprospiraceae bacterium]